MARCSGHGAACSRQMIHRHYETFELPEVPDRHATRQTRRLLSFRPTAREHCQFVFFGAALRAVAVKDIVFTRLAAGDCTDPAFRARCVGRFKSGAITHRVTLDSEGRLTLKPDYQPAYRLAPEQGRRFRIVELEGFVVEFRGEGSIDR